jgi:hypothetical protein
MCHAAIVCLFPLDDSVLMSFGFSWLRVTAPINFQLRVLRVRTPCSSRERPDPRFDFADTLADFDYFSCALVAQQMLQVSVCIAASARSHQLAVHSPL